MTKKFHFDYIYTFDPAEAVEYGFLYTGPTYSRMESTPAAPCSGVYYIGVDKGQRRSILQFLYPKLTAAGIRCDFYLANVVPHNIRQDGIHYNERCTYDEVIHTLQNYSVILDLTEPGQEGVTLRYYEAVCYNKKLITNNAAVRRLPYYSPENMLIFEDPEDIDPSWVIQEGKDYGYSGEFSPLNWIHQIGTESL